jgi:hypothetical protein
VELGEHRLKDIARPVALYQLGDGQFPPLKTISNTNLPRPASSFVGREDEFADVLAKLEEGGARLLTLTGPGGSGKTRLALEVAATLVPEYKAGVSWVGLASLRDAALVTETIAQTPRGERRPRRAQRGRGFSRSASPCERDGVSGRSSSGNRAKEVVGESSNYCWPLDTHAA